MFFEGGGYKSRAGCHGARTVLTYFVFISKKNCTKYVLALIKSFNFMLSFDRKKVAWRLFDLP